MTSRILGSSSTTSNLYINSPFAPLGRYLVFAAAGSRAVSAAVYSNYIILSHPGINIKCRRVVEVVMVARFIDGFARKTKLCRRAVNDFQYCLKCDCISVRSSSAMGVNTWYFLHITYISAFGTSVSGRKMISLSGPVWTRLSSISA